MQDRVKIESGDIREKALGERFDIVTLYNNIYYFPVEDRVSLLLQHIRPALPELSPLRQAGLCGH